MPLSIVPKFWVIFKALETQTNTTLAIQFSHGISKQYGGIWGEIFAIIWVAQFLGPSSELESNRFFSCQESRLMLLTPARIETRKSLTRFILQIFSLEKG